MPIAVLKIIAKMMNTMIVASTGCMASNSCSMGTAESPTSAMLKYRATAAISSSTV